MKKLKSLAVALGAVLVTSSALATPTLVIWDTGGGSSGAILAVSGTATYANVAFDGAWSVVISTAESKPALGSATAPSMDLNVQATSLGLSGRDLHVSWSDDAYGPFNSSLAAKLTGHVVSGTGAGVQYKTFYQAGAGVWNTAAAPSWTLLTDSGVLPPPTYTSTLNGAINQASFGLTEYVTITSSPAGSYSVDASIGGVSGVPDGGTTVMLLGAALSGLACLRRKMA
jgi:VPDSG-CTERM motif